jgi:TonB family protein
MEFEVVGENTSTEAILEANGITGLAANSVEIPPVPRSLPMPVYPRARLVAGTGGVADVEFTIDEQGLTKNVSVMSASEPEFGEAVAAAVAAWVFKPAFFERSRTSVNLRVKHEFALKETDPTARLVEAITAGTVSGAGGLDNRLTPLWRVPPVYPHHLLEQKVTGSATIEFVIDREGRARFPLVKETTHEVFGWAAATAISQWVFAPPMRKGVPVDVKVNIPLEFTPPET